MNLQLITNYAFAKQANGLDYKFTTDKGIVYNVLIDEEMEGYFPGTALDHDAVELVLEPDPGSIIPPGTDPRIEATLVVIVADYLDKHSNAVISYACSYKDAQEAARAQKFTKMFTSGNTQGKYKQVTYKKDRNTGAFIYKAEYPAEADILKEAARLSK